MKHTDAKRRTLERLRADIEMTDMGLDPERIREAEQRAHEAYICRMEEKEEKRERGRSLRRRVMVGAAATLALLVISFGYSAIFPATVSTANNALRRASIWINDKLHLGLEFSQPVDDEPKVDLKAERTYASMNEALEELGVPLVGFSDSAGLILDKVEAEELADGEYRYECFYSMEDQTIAIVMETLGDETTSAVLNEEQMSIETSLGMVICRKKGNGYNAELITQQYAVSIMSNMEYDEFEVLCKQMVLFTEP